MTVAKTQLLFWLALAVFFGWFISLISPILLPFLLGIGIAYLLDPLTDRLEAIGVGRTVATTIVAGLFFSIFILAIIGLIPLLAEQLFGLIQSLPGYLERLRGGMQHLLDQWSIDLEIASPSANLREMAATLAKTGKGVIAELLGGILQSTLAIVNFLGLLVITPVVTFYMLRDWDLLVEDVDDLLPRRHAPMIREQFANIDRTLSAFLRGQLNVMLTLAAFYAITLSLVGLNYAMLIALIGGFIVIIPYVGTIVSGALAVGMAYVQFGTIEQTLLVLAIFVAGQILEGYILTPRFVGKSVGLNPLWIIFGAMAGGAMMGFVGILLAVPVTAVLGVLIRFAVDQYQHSRLYDDHADDGQ